MLVNIALVQHRVGDPVNLDLKLHLFRKQPDFICFPEYWGARPSDVSLPDLVGRTALLEAEMERLSSELACTVIGGTSVHDVGGELFNTASLYHQGKRLGRYQKVHPTDNEIRRGIRPGESPGIWRFGDITVGIAICADCLQPEYFDLYRAGGVDLLFVPNASPHREGEPVAAKHQRDQEIFVRGAARAGAYITKVCGTGTLFGGSLQGRSLVAAPWGILHRVPADEEDRAQVISATLSIQELREFRARMPVSHVAG
jgi:predicted amidohydrolase